MLISVGSGLSQRVGSLAVDQMYVKAMGAMMLLDKPIVTVDREAGAAYVTLTDTMIATTVHVAEDVVVDVDKDNAIASVELLSLDVQIDLDEMARQFVLPDDVRAALEEALSDIRNPAK